MVAGSDQAHSTLELVSQQPRSQAEAEQWKPLPSDPGKQVALDDGKQWVEHGDNGDLQVAPKEDFDPHKTHARNVLTQRPSKRSWRWIIIGGIVGLVLVLGAVLGGVLGSRHKTSGTASSGKAPSTSPSNSSTPSPSVTPSQRNIAAVSFASNSANVSRVYFQDDIGQILEASNTEGNTAWSINKTGVGGKNGSAIAAAVSRPGSPLEISIFYLDVNNLIHDIIYTGSKGSWTSGTLSAQGYTAMANSSLSAMYNWCSLCANTTIIAFQDENGFVQIGNSTSGGWTLTQLGQDLEPALGTGLALQPFYRTGQVDQVNLYYQKSFLNLSLASTDLGSTQGGNGWDLNAQSYDRISSGSPVAAASSYSNISTGFETWIEVLSLSPTGIEVNTWSGEINDWLAFNVHPSAMANSTNNKKTFESVAVTAIGKAYAVVKQDGQADTIESWQVANDMVDWSSVGNVNLNGAWG